MAYNMFEKNTTSIGTRGESSTARNKSGNHNGNRHGAHRKTPHRKTTRGPKNQ